MYLTKIKLLNKVFLKMLIAMSPRLKKYFGNKRISRYQTSSRKVLPGPEKTWNEKFGAKYFECDLRQTLACSSFKLGGRKIKPEAN